MLITVRYYVKFANAQGNGGGLDGKDWFGIGLGTTGFYNDVKGNAQFSEVCSFDVLYIN